MSSAEGGQPAPYAVINGNGNGTPAALRDSPWYVRSLVYALEKFGLGLIVAAAVGAAWWRSSEVSRVDSKEERAALVTALERQTDRTEKAIREVLAVELAQAETMARIRAMVEERAAVAARPRGAR